MFKKMIAFFIYITASVATASNPDLKILEIISLLPTEIMDQVHDIQVEPLTTGSDTLFEISRDPEIRVIYFENKSLHLQLAHHFFNTQHEPKHLLSLPLSLKAKILQHVALAMNLRRPQIEVARSLSECEIQNHTLEVNSCKEQVWNFSDQFSHDSNFRKVYSIYRTQKNDLNLMPNAASFFAGHLTKALIDKNYSCIYPTMNLVFQQMFPSLKLKLSSCKNLKFTFMKDEGSISIDPQLIKSIQLIKVDPGSGLSSWGHIMFNMAICPSLTQYPCSDLQTKNIVFSIHEDQSFPIPIVGALGLTSLVGDIMTLQEAYYGYTIAEHRQMKAYELNLSEQEKIKFASMASDINQRGFGHWNHLFKNCTTTAAFLLNFDLSDSHRDEFYSTIPSTLENKILSIHKNNSPFVRSIKTITNSDL